MTNFENIIQGGPEALSEIMALNCYDYCSFVDDMGCISQSMDEGGCRAGILSWLKSSAKHISTENEKLLK